MENWKDIDGYIGLYQVSNYGRIQSLDRVLKNRKYRGKILSLINNYGYLKINLGHRNLQIVHRLAGQTFIPNPDNKPFINHIDGNPLNNNVSNLEWCTHSENMIHMYRTLGVVANKPMLGKIGSRCIFSKPVLMYTSIGNECKRYDSATEAAKSNGFSQSKVSKACLNGKKYKKLFWAYETVAPAEHKCKWVKMGCASCGKNNLCTYPNCNE
jgi:hypothetical protein